MTKRTLAAVRLLQPWLLERRVYVRVTEDERRRSLVT